MQIFQQKYRELKRLSKRKYIREFISTAGLNPGWLEDKLAAGGQHNLYNYDKNKVIKIARPDFLHLIFGIHSKKEVLNENQIINTYFPLNTVKTEILFTDKYPYYVILQDKVEQYDHLSFYNLRKYKKEFLEIMKANYYLEEKGYSLDFFGRHGLKETFIRSLSKKKLFPVLFNLIVTDSGIKIIDFNLLRISSKTENNVLKRIRFIILNFLYKKLIKKMIENEKQV